MTEPEDTCRPVDVDGETIRVRGTGDLSPEGQEALTALVRVAKAKFVADAPEMVGKLQQKLRLAHKARRAKEHQLDDIRRALCDIGFMDDDDPYSHADLAEVIRQNGQALREETEPAATEATDTEKTARVFAALHQSAEQDVTRVINLYERWVKAGPPPLGVSMSRWWDMRLAELHAAIQPADVNNPARTTANNPIVRDPCPRCEGSPTLIPRTDMASHMRDEHPEEQPSTTGSPQQKSPAPSPPEDTPTA